MRIVNFYGNNIYVRANCLTPFFYNQEFDTDFYDDLLQFFESENHRIGACLTWAMCKSDDFNLLDYDQWLYLTKKDVTADWEQIKYELLKLLQKDDSDSQSAPSETQETMRHYEKRIIASAMSNGMTFDSLKYMTPYDLMNSFEQANDSKKGRAATQKDIDLYFS